MYKKEKEDRRRRREEVNKGDKEKNRLMDLLWVEEHFPGAAWEA